MVRAFPFTVQFVSEPRLQLLVPAPLSSLSTSEFDSAIPNATSRTATIFLLPPFRAKMADVPNQINNITLKLKSKDGEIFEVEKPVAMQINFVKGMLEDVDEIDGMEIPMGEVEAAILAKVVEYCKFHYQQELNQTNADEVDRWERAFVQVDKSTLFQLILVRSLSTVLSFASFAAV